MRSLCPLTSFPRRTNLWVPAVLLCFSVLSSAGQQIDSIVTSASRSTSTIADEIADPSERTAFINISKTTDPPTLLALTRSFLKTYPQSAFLAEVADGAARSSFDLGDLASGIEYAKFSLRLRPENPLLLVALGDVQALLHQDDAAIGSARDALDYLDRFDRPTRIPERAWPDFKKKQEATAWFVIGRARINEALQQQQDSARRSQLNQAISALDRARSLNAEDDEIYYLLGAAYLSLKDSSRAASAFAAVYRRNTAMAVQAGKQLTALYQASKPESGNSFEEYVRGIALLAPPDSPQSLNAALKKQPGYAGSETCGHCHVDIYHQWKQSGMANMLRPYQPQNVIGDFEKNNEYYVGDEVTYQDGKVRITPGPQRSLAARMVLRNGRHYCELRQPDGRWQSYSIDYTIGSKWQQAYATTLPNGEIHVFPIQYSLVEKRWLDYWSIIDEAGSKRADLQNWRKFEGTTSYLLNCAVCHTSQLRNTREGGLGADHLAFREPGIDCEMCHGPSQQHVSSMSSGKFYAKDPNDALEPPVDFHRIGNRDFVTICAQCHMQSNEHHGSPRGELNYSTTGTFYLKEAALPLGEFTRKAYYKDGRFTQATFIVEALERSKCFRKGQANCGSCHDPHGHDEGSNPTSLKFHEPDRMCTGCHTQFADQAQAAAHSHHPAGSEASQCVSCHMPRIVDGMLMRVRSHEIDDIPNADLTLRFGEKESPNACLLCHSNKTAQWLQTQLHTWKTRQAPSGR
jgi:predicted CXXCH cytochrome family protein